MSGIPNTVRMFRPFLAFIFYHFVLSGHSQPNAWEYALSQTEYEGSQFNDILIIDSTIVIGGGLSNCMTPTLWTFGIDGTFSGHVGLSEAPYAYGMITGLRYDSTEQEIYAIGNVAYADDVGARFGIIYRLDKHLKIDTTLDGATIADHNDHEISFLPNDEFLLREHNQLFIINQNLQVRKKLDFPVEPFQNYGVVFMEDTLYTFIRSGHLKSNSITMRNEHGIALKHVITPEYTTILSRGDFLITLGSEGMIRKYDRHSLELQDSLLFSEDVQITLSNFGEDQLQVILYREDTSPVIKIYDLAFELILDQSTGVIHERQVKLYPKSAYGYRIGLAYRSLHLFSDYSSSIVPFVRREMLSSVPSYIDRPSFQITDLTILNNIEADDCGIDGSGEEYCHYGSQPTYYELELENTGNIPITSFGYFSSLTANFNCWREINYQFIDQLQLAPSERIVVRDSFFIFGPEAPDSLLFYICAPNHLLHDEPNSIISYDITTSMVETIDRKISIFPNPVEDIIYFKQLPSTRHSTEVRIYDLKGHLVQHSNLHSDQLWVKLLRSGMYILRIETMDGKVFLEKFIKV